MQEIEISLANNYYIYILRESKILLVAGGRYTMIYLPLIHVPTYER